MKTNVCKICRRTGQKLFLKAEKCYSAKCPLIKKPYVPGQRKKRRRRSFSEYGKELIEKQKMRSWYGLSEKQFKGYIKRILVKKGKIEDASLELVRSLEKRLDNAIFRLGIGLSRRQARQLVNHGNFLVNKKPVNIPSFQLKKGDVISLKEQKKGKVFFQKLALILKKVQLPSWLEFDRKKMIAKVINEPSVEDSEIPVKISSVFEFYSR